MKELAAKSGFELVNVGVDQMDAFMKEKMRLYTEGLPAWDLGKSETGLTVEAAPRVQQRCRAAQCGLET